MKGRGEAMIDINWLVEQGPCKKFSAGQRIPCPGGTDAQTRAMYILLTGRVDVFRQSAAGGTQSAGSLLTGDVFGGREFFTDVDDCVYTAGLDSTVYVISEDSFNDLSWSRPDILFEVMRAAYMPLRKLTALQKTSMSAPIQELVAKRKTAAEKKEHEKAEQSVAVSDEGLLYISDTTAEVIAEVKAEVKAAPDKGAAQQPQEQDLTLAHQLAAALPDLAGIFPEGHKFYPGITKPEYQKLVFPKEYECPNCKRKFKDYRVFRSKLYEASPIRFDLRRYYTDFMTEWYDILVCKSCLFSTFHTYFTEPKPMKKEKIAKQLADARSMIIINFDDERDIDYVFTAHYLAMLCADAYTSVGRQIRAKLWGNLSWLYEDVEDDAMARYSAEMAAKAYEAVYTESRLTPIQEQITCLSIAGMQYRAGMDQNLRKYLFTAKTMQMGDRTYARVAEDFMYELRIEE